MDLKRLGIFMAVFLGVFLASTVIAGVVINTGQLADADSTISIKVSEEMAIKDWYGVATISPNVGEVICNWDTNVGTAALKQEGVFNTTVKVQCIACDAIVENECVSWRNKTANELAADRDEAIKARIESVAEAAQIRIDRQEEALLGKGKITVNTK